MDIKRFDIYRKVPKDLTQPTTTGAIISIVCIVFISLMIFNDILGYLHIDLKNELYVDDPAREGRIDVRINVSFPFMKCEYLGVDIQDENGRHEVGFEKQTAKHPIGPEGCRFESEFTINKVPGNFHISTHSASNQPTTYDMRHEIHEIHFGEDHTKLNLKGSFAPLNGRKSKTDDSDDTVKLHTHEYILRIVPTVYETISGDRTYTYQYTFAHTSDIVFSHSGTIVPAIWFKYELQPLTVRLTEQRQPFYLFITSICAVVGGTFTVAGIIDSTFFTISELLKKHQLGKLN